MGDGGAVRFMLYHGLEHTDPKECKFLLAAKLTSRRARAPAPPAPPAPRAASGPPKPWCGRAGSLGSSRAQW
jgi:hypothetical protein